MAPARPLTRKDAEMPDDRDQSRRLTAFTLAAACVVPRGGKSLAGQRVNARP
jgi:hypothetical protein